MQDNTDCDDGDDTINPGAAEVCDGIDNDCNGTADDGEVSYPNKYVGWTPRLLKAAFNYQYSVKDPGAFAHNAKYVIELLTRLILRLPEDKGHDLRLPNAQIIAGGRLQRYVHRESPVRNWFIAGPAPEPGSSFSPMTPSWTRKSSGVGDSTGRFRQ